MCYYYNESGYNPAASSNWSHLQQNTPELLWQRLKFEMYLFFISFPILNVAPTPKVMACCRLTATRWRGVFICAMPKVNTQLCRSTFQHARRSTQAHAEPSLCSLKPHASEESRSIVSRLLCLWHEEGIVSCEGTLESTHKLEEPPFLLHHLADSLCRLDADSKRRRDVSLTFPGRGWLDGVDWSHVACNREPYFPFWVGGNFLFEDLWVTFSGLYRWERILQANVYCLFLSQRERSWYATCST